MRHKAFQLFILEIVGHLVEAKVTVITVHSPLKYLKQFDMCQQALYHSELIIFIGDNYTFSLVASPLIPTPRNMATLLQEPQLTPDQEHSTSFSEINLVTQSQLLNNFYNNRSQMQNSSDQEMTMLSQAVENKKEEVVIQQISEEKYQKSSNVPDSVTSSKKAQEMNSLETNFLWQDMIYIQKLEQMNNMPVHKINIFQVFPFRLIGKVVNFDMKTFYGFLKPRGW